jgi:hypothetical protein
MCDYSLQNVKSRPAAVGDKLVTFNFGTGTRGFAPAHYAGEAVAVCVLPGTEIAFDDDIKSFAGYCTRGPVSTHKMAIFRQVDKDYPRRHHDCLELPCGTIIRLTDLVDGQRATVLQLPAVPKTAKEIEEQRRVAVVG